MDYKAIDILRTFTKEDIKEFRNFLHSPFFNTSKVLIRLFDSLIVFHPLFNSKFLTEEKLFNKVTPDRHFNKSTIKNLFADLAASCDKYLMHYNFRNRVEESNDFLRNELFKRNLGKYLGSNIKKSESFLEKEKSYDTDFFSNMFKLLTDKINDVIVNHPRTGSSTIELTIDLFEERARYISYFFAKEMMRVYDNVETIGKTFKVDKDNNFVYQVFDMMNFEGFLNFLSRNSTNKVIGNVFELYHALFIAFSRFENEAHYFRYKKLVVANLQYFGPDEIRFHTGRLIRYCMNKCAVNESEEKFEKELFNVYVFILSNKFYLSDLTEYMPVELYRTILQNAIKLKKYKWVYNFINEYRAKLHPDRRKNMYSYSCAVYFFHRSRFAKALDFIHKIDLNHFILKVDLKNLMLMTFYELNMNENVYSLIDSYNHFLSNDKTLSSEEKKKHKNFVNVVQKMLAYKSSSSPIHKFDIERGLQNDLPEKGWIGEKMDELEKQYYKSA